ncbi:hypothetical protein WG902_03760 [Ramlibacter sp. PS3R-8]|uniref:hypothetical protein n=1 Tax=Ramlibacter sp. PS3R-8 TaxID=3133437 RepID=UPI0030986C6B
MSTVRLQGLVRFEIASALSNPAIVALGPHGLRRLQEFAALPPGWDGGASSPLNANSLAVFDQFMRSAHITPPDVAVFMSHEGALILNWPDAVGAISELQFNADGTINLFQEAANHEATYRVEDCADLMGALGLTPTPQQIWQVSLPLETTSRQQRLLTL